MRTARGYWPPGGPPRGAPAAYAGRVPGPAPDAVAGRTARTLPQPPLWTSAASAHAAWADALTAGHRARRARWGERHPSRLPLHDYYGTPARPRLRRWHPGVGVTLEPGPDGPAPRRPGRWYATGNRDGAVSLEARPARRARRRRPCFSATAC